MLIQNRLRSADRGARGFTFVELAVGIAILVVALGSLTATMLSSSSLTRTTEETAMALEAARGQLEGLRAADFRTAFVTFNSTSGAGGFDVPRLTPLPGDADGLPGRIDFPEVLTMGVAELREDVPNVALGMPRDLNADGALDGVDHSADYELLPVRVIVEWQSQTGPRRVELDTILAER